MIIKGKKSESSFRLYAIPIFILLALVVALVASEAIHLNGSTKDDIATHIYCDAENVENGYFVNGNLKFEGGENQFDQRSKSGTFSIRTDGSSPKGIAYTIAEGNPGDVYKASVWRYAQNGDPGYLTIQSDDTVSINIKENQYNEYDKNWWFLIEVIFAIPDDKVIESITISAINEGQEEILFDDFKIEKISTKKSDSTKPKSLFNKQLRLLIEPEAQSQLDKIRIRAQKEAVFIRRDDSQVEAGMALDGQIEKIKLRYKGDWLDHILGPQPSYRIDCKSDKLWQGLQTFSIQHPKTRGYMREWVYHDLLQYVDVLSPRYDFIQVQINNGDKKVYAIEEHFTKFLVESQKRREGPIIKLAEDYFWAGVSRHWGEGGTLAPPNNKERAYWNSRIEPFKLGRTSKDSVLNKQFEIAQSLLYQYKYGLTSTDKIFDIDKLARFMAISEICMAHHSLTWHNQRFYYNPVISLLEPIGFDCSVVGDQVNPFEKNLYLEKVYFDESISTEPINRIFYDESFLGLFFNYLKTYANEDFIESYIALRSNSINKRNDFIKLDEPTYNYNVEEIRERAKKIRITLEPFDDAIIAYASPLGIDSQSVELQNTHSLPVVVTYDSRGATFRKLVAPQRVGQVPNNTIIHIPKFIKKLSYHLPGSTEFHEIDIWPWQSPQNKTPRGEILTRNSLQDTSLFSVNGNEATMRSGNLQINSTIVIPSGYTIFINPGTNITFVGGGKIISHSSIQAKGSASLPIYFKGDGSNGSIAILQAGETTVFRHVIFDNLNTMYESGWKLTGAVTLYESDGQISHCKFINNTCEDALNIIRSTFDVSSSEFANTFSDAFDADFCQGIVSNSTFINTGNDAVDFSTSIVTLNNCTMRNIGDKAVSAGEQATIEANEINVETAITAFASKDKSKLTLRDVQLSDCNTGFAAYQKKPEFGPATIILKSYSETNVKKLFMIENGSILQNDSHAQ